MNVNVSVIIDYDDDQFFLLDCLHDQLVDPCYSLLLLLLQTPL